MTAFGMTGAGCTGCGEHSCDGRCFDETPADYDGVCEDCGFSLPGGGLCSICSNARRIVERDLKRTMELQRRDAA